jgi:hypothetical protein
MTKENVINFNSFLSSLKLNKFDREIRAAIITNSLLAKKIVKEFEETVQGAKDRYLEGLDDEIALLILYREKFKTASPEERIAINEDCVKNCSNVLNAETEINQFVLNLYKEEVTDNFKKFDRDLFVDQCADADIEITVDIIELLNELFS